MEETNNPEYSHPNMLQEIWGKKYSILKSSIIMLAFWIINFAYQFYFLTNQDTIISLIRSFAISGATLIGIALMIGPISKLSKFNYIRYRRTIGVWGFTFIIIHASLVTAYVYNWSPLLELQPLNPIANPVIFGIIAFCLYVPLYSTSTNWAMRKLTFPRWKGLHRIIYAAYVFSIMHYSLVNSQALNSLPGNLLRLVTAAVILLQIAGFVKVIHETKSKKDLAIGLIIIIVSLAALFYVFKFV